jgi:Xaa-Pro aminopeptidase
MEYRDEVYFESTVDPEPAFPPAEYAARLQRVRERLSHDRIDCLFLTSPEAMNWISGYQVEWYQAQSPRQWPAASGIAVHADHDRYILFDTEREAALGRIFTASTDTRYFPRTSLRGGAGFVVDELAALGWLDGTLGLELWSYRPNGQLSAQFQALATARGATIVDGTDVVRELRWVKSPLERAALREAAVIADAGMRAARDALAPGVTELEVYGEMVRALAHAGGENPAITQPVLFGSKTNAAHALSTRRVLRQGEPVMIDLSGVRHRYHVNLARMFHTGEPEPDVADVAARAAASIEVVRALLRPGLPVRELNEALLAYYREQDLWTSRGWIGGYEMGIAGYGDWVGNVVWDPLSELHADKVFEPGTAVNCETQIFLPRHVGQFFSIDTLLFDDDEAVIASDLPATLTVIG